MATKSILPPKVDLSRYIGQWVVVCEDKVVAHDKDLIKVEKEIKACKRVPVVAKIPKKETLIF
jgi:hypothetical protein